VFLVERRKSMRLAVRAEDEVHREIQSPARFVHSAIVYLDDTRMLEARKETSFSRHCRL
jgi:hypothetical protein